MKTKSSQKKHLLLPSFKVTIKNFPDFSAIVIAWVTWLDKTTFIATDVAATTLSVGSPISVQTHINKIQ